MKSQKGFTIIELIVVIAIIAILAAIVMVNVTQYIQKAKNAAAFSDLQSIPTIATDYYADTSKGNGSYANLTDDSRILQIASAITNVNSQYILRMFDEEGTLQWSGGSSYYYQNNPMGPCSGKWVAFIYTGNTVSDVVACTDSSGYMGENASFGDFSDCLCN